MRTTIIGHRGVGKSSFLKRVAGYYAHSGHKAECIDLDDEIEKRTGRKIHEIFSSQGEEAFRKIERETFRNIEIETEKATHPIFVSMGAGFDPSLIPEKWRALWLRRPSDIRGRIFNDRPRLNLKKTALGEFHERFHRRNAAYLARANEVLWLDEGLDSADSAERDFVLNELRDLGGAITLWPELFRTEENFTHWLVSRLKWGVKWFEIRDDLLSEEQMEIAAREIPDDHILISLRKPEKRHLSEKLIESQGLAFDWPVEWGECTIGEPRYLSLHERKQDQSLTQAFERFPSEIPAGTELKAALPVHDFKELEEAHEWQIAAPETRNFLPLSPDGRWTWYRLLQIEKLSLGFFRESDGSGADQPTLLQWARVHSTRRARKLAHSAPHKQKQLTDTFAAVIGDPVSHSRTPIEQHEFFARKGIPVYSIRVTESEWRIGALSRLQEMGLRWAAITSPLKTQAFEASVERDLVSTRLEAVNTLQWNEDLNQWRGTNTDLHGFKHLLETIKDPLGETAVWGGGGTLEMLRSALPTAQFFSVRSGENRDPQGPGATSFRPNTVVWAAGSDSGHEAPKEWQPKMVVDLSYSEDSPGRAFALASNSRYISGLAMFKAQAEAQRRFWETSPKS